MSGSGGKKGGGGKKKKKGKDKWEEAGGEFYTERYPQDQPEELATVVVVDNGGAQGQGGNNRATNSRLPLPLPSHTARRKNSLQGTRRPGYGYLTRKSSYTLRNGNGNGTGTYGNRNGMTMNSTMRLARVPGMESLDEDVELDDCIGLALMPDMADETIPDERTTHDAMLKLKALPESMTQKRMRKGKFGAIPQRRLGGWAKLKWELGKFLIRGKSYFQKDFPSYCLFQGHLRRVRLDCGMALEDVFLFIKGAMVVNILLTCLAFTLIVIPSLGRNVEEEEKCLKEGLALNDTYLEEELVACCSKAYKEESLKAEEQFPWSRGIETTPLFYGHYSSSHSFPVSYIALILAMLGITLLFILLGVKRGIQESVLTSEGEQHPYTNLILAGWDNFTKRTQASVFKRKAIRHEMKVALQKEKQMLEAVLRSRQDQIKLRVLRAIVWALWGSICGGLAFLVFHATRFFLESVEKVEVDGVWERLLFHFGPALLITALNLLGPHIIVKFGVIEKYTYQITTGVFLIRTLFLRLLLVGAAGLALASLKYCDLKNKDTCTQCRDEGRGFRPHCWEYEFGDQFYKLVITDLLAKVLLTFLFDPLRAKLKSCCRLSLFQNIGTVQFSIIRHKLDIIYIQVLVTVGTYFAPFLPVLAVFYFFIVFHLKKCALLTNCNSIPDTFKTTRTCTIFLAGNALAVGVVFVSYFGLLRGVSPSRGCGPFKSFTTPWDALIEIFDERTEFYKSYKSFLEGPYPHFLYLLILPFGFSILILTGYYYFRVAETNRGLVETLRHLLVLEGHDKQYLFARLNSLRRGGDSPSEPRSPRRARNNPHNDTSAL